MKLPDALIIALRNIFHRRLRSWLTLLGIFIGIAAVVALISLGQGLQGAINEQFDALGVNSITIQGAGNVGAPGSTSYGILTDHDINLLEHIQGVETVFGRYIRIAIISKGKDDDTAGISSMPTGKKRQAFLDTLHLTTEEGSLIQDKDLTKIVVGASVKINGKPINVRDKITIHGKEFIVKGKLKKKGNPMFDQTILMNEKTFEELFQTNGNYNLLIVKTTNPKEVPQLKEVIARKMRLDRGEKVGDEDFEIQTPQDILDSLNSILNTVQVLIIGVASISLIVGGIGIANTMFMAILERRREIGIMKAIGAKNKDIQTIFLLESGFLGMVGGIIGVILGLLISALVSIGMKLYFGENLLKFSAQWWIIVGALLFAFIVGILSGWVPSTKAAKLKPIDTIRA